MKESTRREINAFFKPDLCFVCFFAHRIEGYVVFFYFFIF
jgi:hypothetical protein